MVKFKVYTKLKIRGEWHDYLTFTNSDICEAVERATNDLELMSRQIEAVTAYQYTIQRKNGKFTRIIETITKELKNGK